eukprot:4411820-Amphidinium_carterae.1
MANDQHCSSQSDAKTFGIPTGNSTCPMRILRIVFCPCAKLGSNQWVMRTSGYSLGAVKKQRCEILACFWLSEPNEFCNIAAQMDISFSFPQARDCSAGTVTCVGLFMTFAFDKLLLFVNAGCVQQTFAG